MADGVTDDSRGPFRERTLGVWRARTDRVLTDEDAREIAQNVVGFFGILRRWEAEQRDATDRPAGDERMRGE